MPLRNDVCDPKYPLERIRLLMYLITRPVVPANLANVNVEEK